MSQYLVFMGWIVQTNYKSTYFETIKIEVDELRRSTKCYPGQLLKERHVPEKTDGSNVIEGAIRLSDGEQAMCCTPSS